MNAPHMKLNHLNFTVTNVLEAPAFLQKYFGLQTMGGNANMALLSDDNCLVPSLTRMKVGKGRFSRAGTSSSVGCVTGRRGHFK